MYDRVIRNWKTSLPFWLVLIVGLALVYFEKATLTEVGVFLGVLLPLLFVKDPKSWKKSNS